MALQMSPKSVAPKKNEIVTKETKKMMPRVLKEKTMITTKEKKKTSMIMAMILLVAI
jgi:hypothetical protein